MAALGQLLQGDSEGVLVQPLAAALGPLETWRMRALAAGTARLLCLERLPQLRRSWRRPEGGGAYLAAELRSKGPQAASDAPRRRLLLQEVGVRLLATPERALDAGVAGQTAMTWAADYGFEDILAMMFGPLGLGQPEAGVEAAMDLREANGWYPLFRAAWNGRAACVELLVGARACPDGRPDGRYTPLMCAARWGHAGVVAVLLAARAEPRIRNSSGEDAVALAKGQGHAEALEVLQAHLGAHPPGPSAPPPLKDGTDVHRLVSRRARHTLGEGWRMLGREFYR